MACHVRDGAILTEVAPTAEGVKAHPLIEDAAFGSAQFCARCYQFDAPISFHEPLRFTQVAMQDTVQEWSRSSAATRE